MKYLTGKEPCLVGRWLIVSFVVLVLWVGKNELKGQVIDENIPHAGEYVGAGEDSLDYIAQSFVANIRQVHTIGAWLRPAQGEAGVTISLMATQNGLPDPSQVIHESPLIRPNAAQFYFDSSFINLLVPLDTYWVVVDGYQNLGTNGFSAVGVSNQFTDTGAGLVFSGDGGMNWDSIPGIPMAIYVEGDTCTFDIAIDPLNPSVCPGLTETVEAPPGFLSYEWSTGATSRDLQVSAPGTYTVTVVNEDFCVGTGSIVVLPDAEPGIGLDTLYNLCEGESVALPTVPVNMSYLWNDGSTASTNVVSAPGVYTVEVVSPSGCIGRDTTLVVEVPAPVVNLGNDTTLCNGEFIQLDAGAGFDTYIWSTGSTTRSIFVSNDAQVSVFVGDSIGCSATSDTLVVEVNPLPDTPQVQLDLNILLSSFAAGYQWYFNGDELPGETSQSLEPPSTGFYQVEVENLFRCRMLSDTFFLAVEPAGNFIPSGFSPNGDGVNDVFHIEAIDRFPDNLLLVFNRYGDEVFRKQGYQNDWDGTGNQGNALPDGDYFYLLDLGDGSALRRGNVLIHR